MNLKWEEQAGSKLSFGLGLLVFLFLVISRSRKGRACRWAVSIGWECNRQDVERWNVQKGEQVTGKPNCEGLAIALSWLITILTDLNVEGTVNSNSKSDVWVFTPQQTVLLHHLGVL